ncbi:MAG: hypothetical protein AAF921_14455 [Cyanobacteria bacterium P01_D01_bin.44]
MAYRYGLISLLMVLLIGFNLLIHRVAAQSPTPAEALPPFEVALMGDLPYDDEQSLPFQRLIEQVNQSEAAFVIHDGDFKSGSSLCSDDMFQDRKALFNQFRPAFVYIFGDNDWTDCHRANNGAYDPLERLQVVRQLFAAGDKSLGQQPMTLERQSNDPQYARFPENVRWQHHGILFVGLHIVGSNNNLGRTLANDAEYTTRNAANWAWLRDAFDFAKDNNLKGIMLVIQANPGFEKPPSDRTGFNDFISALETELTDYPNPVVLVHGDTHYFRIDKPLPTWEANTPTPPRFLNFTRVETFGSPDVHWLKATIDPSDPQVFWFEPQFVLPEE